ncbi:MFS transporter [Chitinivorax sp. PXF-14]|uniref:MFS transporter n=1 Tax=Chitinivorax sp. PXF-14 TaxID=3230488 RepID=UPI0034654D48
MLDSIRTQYRLLGRPFSLFLLQDWLTLISMLSGKVGLAWWIASHGGARDLAWYGACVSGAILVLTPILAPFGDRFDKRLAIAWALVVMTLNALVVATLCQLGIYRIGLIIGLQLIHAVTLAVIIPATLSVAADVVETTHLQQALAVQKTAQALGRTIGPALGGAALAIAGEASALWLAALFAGISAWATFRVPPFGRKPRAAPTLTQWWHDFRIGILMRWRIPLERYWTTLSFLFILFFAPATGMLMPLMVKARGLSGGWLGVMEMGLSIGMLVGPLALSRHLNARFGRYRANIFCICGEAVGVFVAGLIHVPLALALCFVFIGLCLSCYVLNGQTHRMLAVPDDFRARLMGVNMAIYESGSALGVTIAGVALLRLPVDQLYLVYGVIMGVLALGFTVIPGYRQFISLPHEAVKDYYRRTYPQAFQA